MSFRPFRYEIKRLLIRKWPQQSPVVCSSVPPTDQTRCKPHSRDQMHDMCKPTLFSSFPNPPASLTPIIIRATVLYKPIPTSNYFQSRTAIIDALFFFFLFFCLLPNSAVVI
ncbi:hypothetical protein L873DRAFT_1111462 [Choiromyces venosus 120613-1]|uniref:Uncharacterized protein n=1 Tax=Choiromyces venosus 120613-1 TaxID=1336337 RepID=A0A3N4JH47_9PEZI|nr:hypothetical protein L873DRAFT_1111462 [Choiromyces venosus 120613-1]